MPIGVYPRKSKTHKFVDGIEYKRCSMCKKWYSLYNFQKCKTFKDGLNNYCKACSKIKDAAKYAKRRDAVSKRNKEYYQENKEYILKRNESYVNKNKSNINQYKSDWQKENKGRRQARLNERYRTEPNFRISVNLRTRILIALRKNQKTGSTLELLGCSVDFFKEYLESMFTDGMSWDNHGTYWHIDHKRPCASFDLTDPEQQRQCFHYTNMQPLFWRDNLEKGHKYEEVLRPGNA